MQKSIYLLLSVSFLSLMTNQAVAADGSITITGTHGSDYKASDNVVGTSFGNFTANSSTGVFNQNLIGNQSKTITNQTINFSGTSVGGDVIGLNRVQSGGTISGTNTINISGGLINGSVLGTSDSNNYNGTDRRTSNIINITGGDVGGRVEGGAGAASNIITITGGTIEKSNDGHSHDNNYCDGNSGIGNDDNAGGSCKSGTVYAGVSDAKTKNQSTNGTVILKNMDNSNSFLSSFTEGLDGISGMIFGSNLTGTSDMRFENVDGTYNGGFKDFNNVHVDGNSNLTLGGSTYKADNWNVDGTLDTNGKTVHTYKDTTLDLNIGATGTLTQQFLTDANVNATNAGTINGIRTDKNITLNNSGNMTGNYYGNVVNVDNSGIINSVGGQNTVITSNSPGNLNNTGQIKETLSLVGAVTVNNNTGGNINAQIINTQNTLNINNAGTIDNSSLVNLSNQVINLFNNSGGIISNTLALINGTLNLTNNVGGVLSGNPFTTNAGTFNIINSGTMTGSSSLTATNGGTFSFLNNSTGTVTGNLTVNSGLNTITNNGLFNSLGITNHQNGVVLNNNGTINGTGSILSDTTLNLNNKSGGLISGTQTFKNVALNNASGATISDLALTSDTGTVGISNSGLISGTNSLSSANGGTINLINNNTGTVTGNLTVNSGLNTFTNNGLFNSLGITNHQNGVVLNNNGTINGTGSILSDTTLNLNNNSGGLISGTQTFKNVALNNASGATISDLALTSDTGTVGISNSGLMSGTNSLSSANGGTINLINNNTGTVTGNLTINSGLNTFENSGTFSNLNITNKQNGLTFDNLSDGTVTATTFTADTAMTDIQNSGTFSGVNSFNGTNGGTINFTNNTTGNITGQFTVNGGLNTLDNKGTINNWILASNIPEFTIDNSGTFSGNNTFNSVGKVTLNNSGTSSGNLTLNSNSTVINQDSATTFTNTLIGGNGADSLEINNGISSAVDSILTGSFNNLTLHNNNTDLNTPQMSFVNNANINTQIALGNLGYTSLTNNNTLNADIIDNLTTVADNQCLTTKFDLTNNSTISGDISVKNNIFTLTNNASGLVTSEHIDSRVLNLTNSGNFDANSSYSFSVQNYMDVNNSGTIKGGDMVFKLTGDDVRGKITNSGTIWSHGTTIGMADSLINCPDCGYDNKLELYNSGRLVAVDPVNLIIPDLDSYVVNAPNMDVYNQTGGLIGGSMSVKNYTQEGGSTWMTFMDKNQSLMSTITAQNNISVASGSILYVYTNNDVKQFTDGQEFKVVTADGMTEADVKTQLENYTLKTDSPFADYDMISRGNDGYIVFNKVAPTQFATATDLTTANHNNVILGSHRLYELFVNRDIQAAPQGMSSGDYAETSHVAFMPIAGHAKQDDNGGHMGYTSDYYGGIGYIEHDFNTNLKGGLGFAYLNNDTDYNDTPQSKSTIDSYRPFAYVNYELNNWRFDLAGGWAKHRVNNDRKYRFNDRTYLAKSKYDADEISGHLNIGYRYMLDNGLMLQPMAGLYAANLKTDTYEETGRGPMNMHIKSEDYNSVKSMLGFKIKKEYELENGMTLKPEMHLRWYHEMGDTNGGVTAYFLAQEELFNTRGIDAPKDIGDVAFRLTTDNNTPWDLFMEGYYQFGDSFYNVGGTVGLKYKF